MRRRVAGAGAGHGVAQQRLLDVGVLMRLDVAETRCPRVAAEARGDVERAVQLERQSVVPREVVEHMHRSGLLGLERPPDTVASVARRLATIGVIRWHEPQKRTSFDPSITMSMPNP